MGTPAPPPHTNIKLLARPGPPGSRDPLRILGRAGGTDPPYSRRNPLHSDPLAKTGLASACDSFPRFLSRPEAGMLISPFLYLRGPGWVSGVSKGCRAAWRPQAAATTETLRERVQTIALEEGRVKEGRLPRPFDYAVAEAQVGYYEMW